MSESVHQIGSFSFQCQVISDVGLVRQNNEDALIVAPEIGLFGVCDGLGGHAAGEIASSIASATLKEIVESDGSAPAKVLASGLETANQRILEEQNDHPEQKGMGTTLSAVWLVPSQPPQAWIAHIGDSRVYLLRDGALRQVTDDHSPVFRLHQQGALTKDQLLDHPHKNLLDRSLGILATVEADIFETQLTAGDRILICTDGLTDSLKDGEIEEMVRSHSLAETPEILVAAAKEKGGFDNITLALLEILSVTGRNDSSGGDST